MTESCNARKKGPALGDQARGQHQPPKAKIPKLHGQEEHHPARLAGVADLAEALQIIAEQIDAPSVYMGGPSHRATGAATDALDALIARGFLFYRVDIPEVSDD